MSSTTLSEPIRLCTSCTKPATQYCSACKNHPSPQGIPDNIWYCTPACQTTHWKATHKKECKFRQDRLVLFRLGDTLQKLFYIYREQIFDKLIVRVERRGGKLYVHEGVYGNEQTAMDFLRGFPRKLFRGIEEGDRQGVLVNCAAGDVLIWFYDVIAYLLADIIANPSNDKQPIGLEEMNFIPINISRPIISIDAASNKKLQNQRDRPHVIIRVAMKDWTCFAFDLAGAQHGWFAPVMNLKDYMEKRIHSDPDSCGMAKFGTLRKLMMARSGEGGEGVDATTVLNESASGILKRELVTWQVKEGNMMVSEMCKLGQSEFERMQRGFLGYMKEKLEEHVGGERKLYFDAFKGAGREEDSDDGDRDEDEDGDGDDELSERGEDWDKDDELSERGEDGDGQED